MHLLPDGVVIMDDVLFLEWCNPAAEQHLGLSNERDKGMRVTNLVRNPDFMDYIILGRYDQPLTISFRDRKLIVQIIPFENRRQILVTHDVTETERIEEMRRDFIANASHELRTPLTVIVGFLEIAARKGWMQPPARPPEADDGAGPPHAAPDRRHADPVAAGVGGLSDAPEPVDVKQADGPSAARREALSAGKHEISMDRWP
jgi:two-component system phosphate regulon sensor histidine kinase PhoR